MLGELELKQIESQGISLENIELQINYFKHGFPQINLVAAATPSNGIKVLNENEEERMVSIFENALNSGLDILKFVPASGAASRMFKDLFTFLESAASEDTAEKLIAESKLLQTFFNNLTKFAFYSDLNELVSNKESKIEWVEKLLTENGLGYGQKPKGQLIFHKQSKGNRTAFEEHLFEAAAYCAGTKGNASVHFTVSPEHQKGFESILARVKTEYQKRLGLHFDITFSHQKKSTDTIAVDINNEPFRDNNGNIIFRPGGHGALIENLADLDADIIFIKNIDNVVPDHLKSETKKHKKILAGTLISYREKIYSYIEMLNKTNISDDILRNIENFIQKELCIHYQNTFASATDKIQFLKKILNRPIRVCGMVRNEGEPGGGPFWAKNQDSTISLQIIERAQINENDPNQKEILEQSTHFNPVDLVCSIKNYKGEKFNLLNFRDNNTGFISSKSFDGKELKALELPGLWNGAMSDWNTIFVEVPLVTFNPVKTVNDLLRPEHQ
jgi:hypothetical protein